MVPAIVPVYAVIGFASGRGSLRKRSGIFRPMNELVDRSLS